MKKVILFDLDGTLIDSTEAILESFYYSFKTLNFDFKGSDIDIKREIGYPLEVMYENLGVNRSKIDTFVNMYKKHYREISLQKTILLDTALQSIKLAYSFATLGIVTTKTTKYTIPLLRDLGILKYFKTIIGRQEVINPKPHPEPILKAIENLDVTNSNSEIYMIGDTKLDLISAKNAGIIGIGVLCGYGTYNELKQYSSIIVPNSIDAVKYIKNSISYIR